ncbi:MAG: hypothetical protein AUG51_16665 [Acidobacteria bacterium 13_1_20CM_3_53_8]|nr:MAG: hypothetical protein AUG51_16665 [Acidobacteria bacterium 13_1_20CM_3_53_8]
MGAFRRQQFGAAVQIYISLVSVHYSDFPINLSFGHRKELNSIFDAAAPSIGAELRADPATPLDDLQHGFVKEKAFVATTSLCNSPRGCFGAWRLADVLS